MYVYDTYIFLKCHFRSEHFVAPEAGHGRKVFAIRFHPYDDNVFLTGGWDRCIKVKNSLSTQFWVTRGNTLTSPGNL